MLRFCLVLGTLLSVSFVTAAPPKVAHWPEQELDRWEKVLYRKVSLTAKSPTLVDLATLFRAASGENVLLDERALKQAGIEADQPRIGGEFKEVSLDYIARRLLGRELQLVPRDGALVITTEDELLARTFVRSYDVTDLVGGDESALQQLIDPDSWNEPPVFARGVASRLIIRHTPSVHQRIERLLQHLAVSFHVNNGRQGSRK